MRRNRPAAARRTGQRGAPRHRAFQRRRQRFSWFGGAYSLKSGPHSLRQPRHMRRAQKSVVIARYRFEAEAGTREPLPLLDEQRGTADRPARLVKDELSRIVARRVSYKRFQMPVEALVLEHGRKNLQETRLPR